MDRPADSGDIGDYLISARSFDEYHAMFALTTTDLRGSVLDCPAGGSGFTAFAAAAGASSVAADPAFAMRKDDLAHLVLSEAERGSAHTAANAERYRWDFYGDVDGHRAMRQESATRFAADLAEHPNRYVAARLPCLPFRARCFDVVLSSHFLFTYADRLDFTFHLQALMDLHRVSRFEVRVFPLLDHTGRECDRLVEQLRATLGEQSISTEVRAVDYEFQRGGNHMLVLNNRAH